MEQAGHQGAAMAAELAVELLARRQRREGAAQVAAGVAVEPPLAAEALPLAEDRQRQQLGAAERGRGPGVRRRRGQVSLAEIVDHDIQGGEEGVRVDHGGAPLLGRKGAARRPTGAFRSSLAQLTPSVSVLADGGRRARGRPELTGGGAVDPAVCPPEEARHDAVRPIARRP